MKLEVIRDTFTDKSTIGKLTLGGRFFCYTLEDVDRDINKALLRAFELLPSIIE